VEFDSAVGGDDAHMIEQRTPPFSHGNCRLRNSHRTPYLNGSEAFWTKPNVS